MTPSPAAPLNRRQWLKVTGVTLAGAALTARLPAGPVPASQSAPRPAGPAQPAEPRGERRYVHGFEAYPGS